MIRLEAYIDSWQGQHAAAAVIADAMAHECPVTIVGSEPDANSRDGRARWIVVPDHYYFGAKLQRGLEEFKGHVFIHVMADVTCDDWPALVRRCRYVFETIPDLGIWTPMVRGRDSPWDASLTMLMEDPDRGINFTSQTDQLVWAMSWEVADRLRWLTPSRTNLGWGCDIAAAAYCHSKGRLVCQDRTVTIHHGHGTRYDSDKAAHEMWNFLDRATLPEKLMVKMMERCRTPQSVSP